MDLSQKAINRFQKKILSWFAKHKRDLPWRHTRDPYRIWVSEIMLQQTQVARVISKYEAWLEKFPTIASLASAGTREVLTLWSGMGYNRRALNLQRAAKEIISHYSSSEGAKRQSREVLDSPVLARTIKFPQTIEELKKLPGVGEYTARAILCFAFDEQIAVVDTNVRKVILTQLCQNHPERSEGSPHVQSKEGEILRSALPAGRQAQNDKMRLPRSLHTLAMTDKQVQEIADRLLPRGKAYEWNQALMDYASAVLKKEKIPIPKQSRFIGSNRYYRGKIIKVLLQEQEIGLDRLQQMVKEDYQATDHAWFEGLLMQLEKEGFLTRKTNTITLRMRDGS